MQLTPGPAAGESPADGSERPDAGPIASARIALQQLPPQNGAPEGSEPPARLLGLAVSGGSDSMAMLHVFAQIAAGLGWQLEVATVDHRLRPEAALEAQDVARICQDLGLTHEILIWDDHPQTGNMPAAAREARYALLASWARRRGIAYVTLAHTANDQAETFLMGLSRAAGLEGLSGMRPAWDRDGIRFLRPFLGENREQLRDFLRRRGLGWHDDPTNEADRYSRVKARRALAALEPLGLGLDQLTQSIRNLSQVAGLLRKATADCAEAICRFETGALMIRAHDFWSQDPEMQRRLLVAAIRWFSGAYYPPRADSVASLQRVMMAEGRTATLGGCRFARIAKPAARLSDGDILITREPRAVSGPKPWTPGLIWDHRWRIDGPEATGGGETAGLEVRALTAAGLARAKDWRDSGLRREALIVSPALWQGDRLVAVPLLPGFSSEWRLDLYPSFGSFILSH